MKTKSISSLGRLPEWPESRRRLRRIQSILLKQSKWDRASPEAVFQAPDFRVKLGGALRRLLLACFGGGLIAAGLLLAGSFGPGRNWQLFRSLFFIERYGDNATTDLPARGI